MKKSQNLYYFSQKATAPKIYAISDYNLTPYDKIEAMLKEAIYGGIKIFQLRDKYSRDEDILEVCVNLAEICLQNKVEFIINDRANIALYLQEREIECGLHLGIDDEENMPFEELRKVFSGTIGVSCYGDMNRALDYEAKGADYVAFGSIFKSKTKPYSEVVGCDILVEAKRKLRTKICAIGGINIDNITQIKGADMVAMVSEIWQGNVYKNVENLVKVMELSQEK